MHILITNDDGPPSQQSSPYVHSLVDTLEKAGHKVSVILPDTQKSWIGKAHLVGQTMKPTYFQPGALHTDDGKISKVPSTDGSEDWILINGTPASCVQIGLHHFFADKGPVDLVVSGPNYGRNTTALFSLSSGTIGGAMEGAICGKKSIAISYAFDSRNHDPEIIKEASQRGAQVIEYLYSNWPETGVDLFNVNVPLRKGVISSKVVYADILPNKWSAAGNSYDEVLVNDDEDANEHEHEIREREVQGPSTPKPTQSTAHRHFKWNPRLKEVYESVEKAGPGSDGWAVKEGWTSITPLRANFWHVQGFDGEIKLDNEKPFAYRPGVDHRKLRAVINYPDSYVQPLIMKAIQRHLSSFSIDYIDPHTTLPFTSDYTLQIRSYETLDLEQALSNPSTSLINAYIIRKALIRKHYLSNTIATWIVKNPESVLKNHFKPTVDFELDYAEFLDDALLEAYELHEDFNLNETRPRAERNWWILKPGMSDGGNGIRLFSTFKELESIFQEWDEPSDDEDVIDDDDSLSPRQKTGAFLEHEEEGAGAMTSQLRHFIAQPYIDPPLLLHSKGNKKFHIRVYVLAVGALQVYVYREMLALFAAKSYVSPGSDESPHLASHLTNTCFQDESTKDSSVFRFWSLEEPAIKTADWKEQIWEQICQVTGEVFEAAARGQMVHFQTLPNAFELFGVDFMVDASLNVWLLELNAFPDFKQTGPELQETVVGGLFDEGIQLATKPFFEHASGRDDEPGVGRMRLVRELDLGRR